VSLPEKPKSASDGYKIKSRKHENKKHEMLDGFRDFFLSRFRDDSPIPFLAISLILSDEWLFFKFNQETARNGTKETQCAKAQ
jgi:hypothetical protein